MTSHATRRRWLIVSFWPAFGAFSGLQIQLSMLSHNHSWILMLSYQILVWGLWIPITFAIGWLLPRLRQTTLTKTVLVHAPIAYVFGFVHVAMWVAIELILEPYDFMNPTAYWSRLTGLAFYQVPIEMLLYGLVALAYSAEEASLRARERERRTAQLETSLAEARLHALELQTQPHFLFNTLNGIGALVRSGQPRDALTMISGLSDLLRYALDRAGGAAVPVEEEAKNVERYLEIQHLRFPDRLAFDVCVAPDAARGAVPALLLQPLVENAVRHGLAKSEAPGRIALHAKRDGDRLRIDIVSTGRLDPERRNGIGVSNTLARLSQLYGDGARFELAEHDEGVLARVEIPWSEAK